MYEDGNKLNMWGQKINRVYEALDQNWLAEDKERREREEAQKRADDEGRREERRKKKLGKEQAKPISSEPSRLSFMSRSFKESIDKPTLSETLINFLLWAIIIGGGVVVYNSKTENDQKIENSEISAMHQKKMHVQDFANATLPRKVMLVKTNESISLRLKLEKNSGEDHIPLVNQDNDAPIKKQKHYHAKKVKPS